MNRCEYITGTIIGKVRCIDDKLTDLEIDKVYDFIFPYHYSFLRREDRSEDGLDHARIIIDNGTYFLDEFQVLSMNVEKKATDVCPRCGGPILEYRIPHFGDAITGSAIKNDEYYIIIIEPDMVEGTMIAKKIGSDEDWKSVYISEYSIGTACVVRKMSPISVCSACGR